MNSGINSDAMSSFIVHVAIGVIVAELLLHVIERDPDCVKRNRIWYWAFGALGGLLPDLDAIPGIITGQTIWTYHHTYTHTLIALLIVLGITALFKFQPLAIAFLLGYAVHLFTDFLDNSIMPFSPWDQTTEWGLELSDYLIAIGWYINIDLGFEVFQANYIEVALSVFSIALIPMAMYLIIDGMDVDEEVSCIVNW